MSCSCAVVGSEGMPVSEVISHEQDGLLVPMDDPVSLTKVVDRLLSNPRLRNYLGENARKKALKYDHKVTLPLFESLIPSLSYFSQILVVNTSDTVSRIGFACHLFTSLSFSIFWLSIIGQSWIARIMLAPILMTILLVLSYCLAKLEFRQNLFR